jgi:4-alpha-glucanotransferase
MQCLPGLTISTRRFDKAKELLAHFAKCIKYGVMVNRFPDCQDISAPDETGEHESADVTLWWAWSLEKYYRASKDKELIAEQLPVMIEAAQAYLQGATPGIAVDANDGLLRCAAKDQEFTWMDAKVQGMPITPRPGKAVELCALWYNFLSSIGFLSGEIGSDAFEKPFQLKGESTTLSNMAQKAKSSMQKFWNEEKRCLFDVIEMGVQPSTRHDESVRCNQLLAVSLPFRAFSIEQEKMILRTVEEELLTPMGVRTLSTSDPSYQGIFGCGLAHPDEYHRDLSRHQGTAYPWWLGQYCDALLNVYGSLPETVNRVRLTLQPLLDHSTEEDCLGSISEMFDGSRPQLPRGCPVSALSVAETMRWLRWIQKQ